MLRSGFASFVLYGGTIVGILLVLPKTAIGSLNGFIDAVKAVFTVIAPMRRAERDSAKGD